MTTTKSSTKPSWDLSLSLGTIHDLNSSSNAWMAESLCAQVDPELFFPDKGASTKEAKKVCQKCPVTSECLEYAMSSDDRYGVFGGLSERDRRKLRKEARSAT